MKRNMFFRYKESEIKLKKSKPSKEYNGDLGRLNFSGTCCY